MLPYLELDPQTALVQTPQHFFNVDHTGDVFNHQNATFFFGCQTGLDSWRATVCCGTNFAVRAAPLAAIGWFPTESITEDFLLSLKLTASGWHCRYHGHVLTTGEAPEDLRQIFKQRSRWCTGCFQVFFQVETFMWVRQLPAIQMLCYFNSIMGYLSTVICFPVFLIVPVVSVYTKTHPVKELTEVLVILWIGYFISLVAVVEMMPRTFSRFTGFLGSKVRSRPISPCRHLAVPPPWPRRELVRPPPRSRRISRLRSTTSCGGASSRPCGRRCAAGSA